MYRSFRAVCLNETKSHMNAFRCGLLTPTYSGMKATMCSEINKNLRPKLREGVHSFTCICVWPMAATTVPGISEGKPDRRQLSTATPPHKTPDRETTKNVKLSITNIQTSAPPGEPCYSAINKSSVKNALNIRRSALCH